MESVSAPNRDVIVYWSILPTRFTSSTNDHEAMSRCQGAASERLGEKPRSVAFALDLVGQSRAFIRPVRQPKQNSATRHESE
jgi:hypothetical protein